MESVIISCSACVKEDLSIKEIEKQVNIQNPTGISSKWRISKDKTFRNGEINPCQCKQNNNRKHYLLNC